MEGVHYNDVSGSVLSPIAWVCRVRWLKWRGLLKYIHVQRTSLNRVEIHVQSPQGFVDAYKHIKKGGKKAPNRQHSTISESGLQVFYNQRHRAVPALIKTEGSNDSVGVSCFLVQICATDVETVHQML